MECCLTVRNRANGFYANHHLAANLAQQHRLSEQRGLQHAVQHEQLKFRRRRAGLRPSNEKQPRLPGRHGSDQLEPSASDVTFNYFTLPVTVATNDFMSLDECLLTLPRQTNGELPYIAFPLQLNTSDWVDAGTKSDSPSSWRGAGPGRVRIRLEDPPPTLGMTQLGNQPDFCRRRRGRAGGANYLVATTNLALPPAQWTTIATNFSDLAGNSRVHEPHRGRGAVAVLSHQSSMTAGAIFCGVFFKNWFYWVEIHWLAGHSAG